MGLPAVIFEDESIIAFDKPSGLPVAPERRGKHSENLMEEVHARLGRHIANVHRLDADSSGIVLCAKTKPALDYLSGQFQSKTAVRRYLALCALLTAERAMKVIAPIRDEAGRLPSEFEVDLPMGEDEANPGRMRIFRRRGGKPATTRFRTLEHFRGFAWVECNPITGRTHQVRLHLAAAAAPVLNDALYGDPDLQLKLSAMKRGYKGRDDEKPLIQRLALHAAGLGFAHPVTREIMTLSCELPHEFEVALKYLRRFSETRS